MEVTGERVPLSGRLQHYHVQILLLVAFLVRAGVFFHLDTVTLGWRQADMSSIAINYLQNGFRFLYPQIFWGGAGPGYVEMEFPILPFVTAVLYKVFGVSDVAALSIPFLCGIGVVLAVYKLGVLLFDKRTAFVAGLLVAVSPLLTLASQTFLGEPALLLCTVLGMYYLLRWSGSGTLFDVARAALFTSLAILLKLTALYIGFPLLAIFLTRYGRKSFARREFWFFGIATLLPVLIWYAHAHSLYRDFGNTFGILSGGYNKFAHADLLLSPEFYILMIKRISLSVVSPVVVLCAVAGLLSKPEARVRGIMGVWIGSLLFYTLLVAEGNKDMIYYQLPWLPPLALLGSSGFFAGLAWLTNSERIGRGLKRWCGLLFASALCVGAVGVAIRAEWVPITVVEKEARLRALAHQVKAATPPTSLIVVASSYGDDKTPETIDTPPQVFFFSERRGWYLALAWLTPQRLDQLRSEGAGYVVVADDDVEILRNQPSRLDALTRQYPPVIQQERLLVLSLASPPAP
jgi:4-amino-4-deoxy-L-arabinose transferase-like glycosyltransferase